MCPAPAQPPVPQLGPVSRPVAVATVAPSEPVQARMVAVEVTGGGGGQEWADSAYGDGGASGWGEGKRAVDEAIAVDHVTNALCMAGESEAAQATNRAAERREVT
jgi:hypothetical protein